MIWRCPQELTQNIIIEILIFNVGCKLLSTQLHLWFVQYCPPSFLSLSIREFVNKLVFKNVMMKNNIVPFFKYNPCLQLVLIVLWAMFPCPLQVECLLVEGVLDKRNLVYCASTRCLQIFHVCSYVDIPAHFTFSDAYCFFFQVSLLSNLMCIFFVVKFAVLVKVSSLKFWCWGGYCQVGIWQFLSFPMCQYVLKRFLNIYTALEWSETYLCLIIHLTFTGWTSWTTSWATG
jgi:hypothetical protein